MPRVLEESAGVNAPERYVQDINLHDDALWRALTEARWADPAATKLLYWETPGGGAVFLRVVAREPGSTSSRGDWWIMEKRTWAALERLAARPGTEVRVGFVDEHGEPRAVRRLTPRLKKGQAGARFWVLRPGPVDGQD